MKKHSIKERLLAVKLCMSGMPPKAVHRKLGICEDDVAVWCERYRLFGEKGLRKIPHKHLKFEEKCKIICECQEKNVPLHIVSAKYNVSRSRLSVWKKIVREKGYEGLRETKNRGRPPKIMGRPKKREPQTELEKLQWENEYLRAENAYLKKLRALRIEE